MMICDIHLNTQYLTKTVIKSCNVGENWVSFSWLVIQEILTSEGLLISIWPGDQMQ